MPKKSPIGEAAGAGVLCGVLSKSSMEEVPGPKGSGSFAKGSENVVGNAALDDATGVNELGCIVTPGPRCAATGVSQTLEGCEVPESMKSSKFGSSVLAKEAAGFCTASA